MFLSRLTDIPVFRIVLRDAKRYDTYETREFDLPLNSEFPIGRASSNAAKRELMAAPHNAFIDSPVISRQHAVLSANANSGVPEVYVTDKGSMHGTMLNGQRLSANTPTKLNDGDVLQFGTDVNRNEGTSSRRPSKPPLTLASELTPTHTEFFVARTYTFESQLSRPFSLGFTVPDAESDEEEVAERRGSQIDPFVIDDDSDAADDHSEADDQEEVTMIMDQVLQPNEHGHTLSVGQDDYPPSAMRTTLSNEDYNPESFASRRDDSLEPASPNPSSDEEDVAALGSDSDSEAGSIDSSEMMSDSEPEIQDSEDEEMEEGEHKKPTTSSSNKENEASVNSQVPQTVHCFPRETTTLSLSDVYMPQDAANTQASLPRMYMYGMQGSDSNSMSNSNVYGDNAPPPLLPRPSASRTAPWCDLTYRSFREVNDLQEWYSEGIQQPNYLGTNFGDRPSLFSQAPLPSMAEANETRAPMPQFNPYPSQPMQASRLQTPPPYFVPDFETSPPVQPGRRTKVSIEEIVEEQPPTPESVKDLKRKADVLEADEPVVVLDELSKATIGDEHATSNLVAAVPVDDAAAIQTAAIIAQRPKKTPRSVLSKVLNKAAYPLLGATGAVVSFALLSTLPDAFFV
ncbi:hypothetical protein J4E93_009445 [Alternaria ventricosa]|uniref:uncharacterized protein n=1 Tax=Alternaria ventricosa TaxID=1187951 RepID=UPI0020C1FFD0|nr:uncharacterized protein J4E93_009445 [Alternaria ventricosa]KAI4639266.1 hypothetical protein J4E93_009445 [Alternaria ventricosa]